MKSTTPAQKGNMCDEKKIIIKKTFGLIEMYMGVTFCPQGVDIGTLGGSHSTLISRNQKSLTAKVARYDSVIIRLVNFKTILQHFITLMAL